MVSIIALGVIIAIGLVIDIWFISAEYAGLAVKATVLKGVAAAFFVVLGAYCAVCAPSAYAYIIVAGLAFGMIGDIMLNARNCVQGAASNRIFAIGIVAFVLGHVLYLVALFMSGTNLAVFAVLTVVISIAAVPTFIKRIEAPSAGLRTFGIVYLVIVIGMFSAAAGLVFAAGTPRAFLFCVGALLFMVSDFIMIYYFFGPKKIKPLRAINLLCYYVGQICIAITILLG